MCDRGWLGLTNRAPPNECFAPAPPPAAGASFWCRAATTLRQGARVIEDNRRLRLADNRPHGSYSLGHENLPYFEAEDSTAGDLLHCGMRPPPSLKLPRSFFFKDGQPPGTKTLALPAPLPS